MVLVVEQRLEVVAKAGLLSDPLKIQMIGSYIHVQRCLSFENYQVLKLLNH